MHAFETLRKVLACVVVQGKVRVAVSDYRRVKSKNLLLNDETSCLQLNCLENIAKSVLNICHFGNAGCDI